LCTSGKNRGASDAIARSTVYKLSARQTKFVFVKLRFLEVISVSSLGCLGGR